MSDKNLNHMPPGIEPAQRVVCSYDSGYEHSLQHYVEVTRMVEEEDRGPHSMPEGPEVTKVVTPSSIEA
jgi:hypothetical protein